MSIGILIIHKPAFDGVIVENHGIKLEKNPDILG